MLEVVRLASFVRGETHRRQLTVHQRGVPIVGVVTALVFLLQFEVEVHLHPLEVLLHEDLALSLFADLSTLEDLGEGARPESDLSDSEFHPIALVIRSSWGTQQILALLQILPFHTRDPSHELHVSGPRPHY